MTLNISLAARWIAEDGVWLTTSESVPGLVVESPTWPEMVEEVRRVLPDLLDTCDVLNLVFMPKSF